MRRCVRWVWNPYEGHRYDPCCCVYRVWDPDTGELLYVGQTSVGLKSRIKAHWKAQPWFRWEWSAALVTYEEYPTQISAMVAEAFAIDAENPKHNKDRPDWRVIADWARGRPDFMQAFAFQAAS